MENMDHDIKPRWPARAAQQGQGSISVERRRALLWLGAAGLSALAADRDAQATDSAPDQAMALVHPPRQAPAFSLQDINGKMRSMAEYRSKVVLVNFWATWCSPCEVLALDQSETLNQVFAYMGQIDPAPAFPVLLDQHSKVAHAFGGMGIPTTYLIDKQGLIVRQAVGGRDYTRPEIRRVIEDLMR